MKKIILSSIALACMTANAAEFGKPIVTPVPITKNQQLGITEKDVVIMNIKLSDEEHAQLLKRFAQKSKPLRNAMLPASIDLGMNGVPVLNQGRHGSCVTFADTAAVDAVLGKGDYVSQLCSLELGTHLENNGYGYSGWNGSYGPLVLQQMMLFGIVSKDNQKNNSCAGVNDYPLTDAYNEGNEMLLTEYKGMSEDITRQVHWTHIIGNDELFDTDVPDANETERALLRVKETLVAGDRMTIGTYLIVNGKCRAGSCASYHAANDTWALTKEIETIPHYVGGHEMVIIGYDDNAVAYDRDGNKHAGLLKLRNSWGDNVGDNGDYYMTYDYFKKFVNEVQVVAARHK